MKIPADSVHSAQTPTLSPPKDFCRAEPTALKRWLEDLPHNNLGESATQAYHAITTLNQCQLDTKLRFQLLETIRPVIHSLCESLSVYLRSQPAVLAPTAYKALQLAQQMQIELACGYELLTHPTPTPGRYGFGSARTLKKQQQTVARALHRALNERTRCLFRCQLLYTDVGTDLWQPIHGLYRTALENDLQGNAFADRVAGHTSPMSIEQCYIRALLLGGLHANQLRQEDLLQIFEYMPEWVMLAELAPYSPPDEDQLVVNLESSNPPVFSSCIEVPAAATNWRLLLVDKLLYHLGEQLANNAHNTLSDNLIKHLLLSWGSDTPRVLMRMESNDTLSICLGLANVHFFSAGEVQYNDFLNGTPSLSGLGEPVPDTSPYRASQPRSYEVRAINVSQGGYGLAWPEQASERVRNGDIVGIRNSDQGNWAIGLISWLRRREGQPTQLGVKLLGQSVQPFGARMVNALDQDTSVESEYRRVLFLPAIVPINQPASLITQAQCFEENARLLLVQQGRQMEVRLSRLISSTGSINLFEVDIINQPASEAEKDFQDLGESLTADWPAL